MTDLTSARGGRRTEIISSPGVPESLRHRGRETAREYTWARVIDFLKIRLQFLGLAQGWGAEEG